MDCCSIEAVLSTRSIESACCCYWCWWYVVSSSRISIRNVQRPTLQHQQVPLVPHGLHCRTSDSKVPCTIVHFQPQRLASGSTQLQFGVSNSSLTIWNWYSTVHSGGSDLRPFLKSRLLRSCGYIPPHHFEEAKESDCITIHGRDMLIAQVHSSLSGGLDVRLQSKTWQRP